jgi:hypothetical protein
LGVGFEDGFRLNPLGELVQRDEQVSETTMGLHKRPDHIETLDHEWPSEKDGLQRLRWQVGLPSVELTPLARADNLLCIVQCYRPVEALEEGLADWRPRSRVVSTDASMDLQEFLALMGRDAFHQHSHRR